MADSSQTEGSATLDADLSGRDLGDYRVLRRLGRGGMAEVYLAEQKSLRRQVAVKVLKSSLAIDDKYVRRFHMEAQAAASLVHATIVQIHEVGCIDGLHFIVQEYVPGLNLRERLSREGPADLRISVKIMRGVAAALNKASEKGIVHRDIKPENIMLAKSGEVKVADFGLARIAREGADLNLTQVGQTMGTPLYMSPEQVEGRPLDTRSDIYSLGVTSYHMLTGNPPFRGETALAVAVQHLKNQPERLENLRPDLPPALCRIVHRMLAKEPEHRYGTPRELLKELRALQVEGLDDDEDVSDTTSLYDSNTPASGLNEATQQLDRLMKTGAISRVARRRRWVWAALVFAAFVGGSLAAWQSRPKSLLADARAAVEVRSTSQVQLFYAQMEGTEEAWQAVIDNFPKADYHVHQAEQEIALINLERPNGQAKAMELFTKLASLGENDVEFKAFGCAGRAVVLSMQKKHEESKAVIAELIRILDPKPARNPPINVDNRMQLLLQEAYRNNGSEANWPKMQQLLERGAITPAEGATREEAGKPNSL